MTRFPFRPLALAALLAAAPAGAVAPLAGSELRELCRSAPENPQATGSRLCVLYINGFLDGAVATDERVARNVADEIDRGETLSERAIRTRIIRRLEVQGPTGYAEFCVGQPVPVVEVIRHVNDEFALRRTLEGVDAKEIVYGALRRHYPCRP